MFAHASSCDNVASEVGRKPRLGSLLDRKLKRKDLASDGAGCNSYSMENLIAIGAGLALRTVIDILTDNDDRLTGASFSYRISTN